MENDFHIFFTATENDFHKHLSGTGDNTKEKLLSRIRLYTVINCMSIKPKIFYVFRKGLFIMRKMFYVMCAAGVAASLAGCTKMDTAATTAAPAATEAAAKEEIAQRESSGSYTAQNGQYYGRYQLASSYLNGDLSPENQEKVADNYVASRYGSWTAALAFWNANGWY